MKENKVRVQLDLDENLVTEFDKLAPEGRTALLEQVIDKCRTKPHALANMVDGLVQLKKAPASASKPPLKPYGFRFAADMKQYIEDTAANLSLSRNSFANMLIKGTVETMI